MGKRDPNTRYTSGGNGDVRSRRAGLVGNGEPEAGDDAQDGNHPLEPDTDPNTGVARTLAQLLSYDEGWLRMTPDGEHKQCFLKFKWKRGAFQGNYVMAVVPPHEVAWGLELLLGKVRQVYDGKRVPTPDTPYGF